MNFRPQKREDPEVGLTPLIDVVFLLLIFFMVSTTFDKTADLKIELPDSSQAPTEAPDKTIEISINAKGQYFVNRQQLVSEDPKVLKAAITKTLGEEASLPVLIHADRQTPYQAVITVLDVVGQMGLTDVSLPTVHEDQE